MREKAFFESLGGWIELQGRSRRLAAVRLLAHPPCRPVPPAPDLLPYLKMLQTYFAGTSPGEVPARLDIGDQSAFRRAVYERLSEVRFGEVISYGELARRVGREGAARAVGQAVGANPLPIFIPCHRVIRSDHRLGGFSSGRQWKVFLLRHEGHRIRDGRLIGQAVCR